MVVVAHLAETVDDEIAALAHQAKDVQPGDPVKVNIVDGLTPVITRRDMIKSACKFKSEWSGHPTTVALRLNSGMR